MEKTNPIKTVALLIGLKGTKKFGRLWLRLIISRCSPFVLSGKGNAFINYKYHSDAAWISPSTNLKEAGGIINQ